MKALEFYAEVFGATERTRFLGPDGSIAHAEVESRLGEILQIWSVGAAPRRSALAVASARGRQPLVEVWVPAH